LFIDAELVASSAAGGGSMFPPRRCSCSHSFTAATISQLLDQKRLGDVEASRPANWLKSPPTLRITKSSCPVSTPEYYACIRRLPLFLRHAVIGGARICASMGTHRHGR